VTVSSASTVDFNATVLPFPAADSFLTVTRSGSLLTFAVSPQAVAGDHYAVVSVAPSDKSLPTALVGVVYHVTASAPSPDLVAPDPVVASQDSTALLSSSFTIKPGAGLLSYTVIGPPYVTFASASGTLSSSGDTKVPFSIDPSKLKLGINKGTIQVQFSNGTTETVQAWVAYLPRFAVAAALASAQTKAEAITRAATSNCTPSQLAVATNGLPGGFARPLGWPASLQARIVDDCGNPVTNANVLLTFSDGEPAVLAQLDSATLATYTANWNPSLAGNVTVTVRADAGTSVTSALTGSTTIAGSVTPNQAPLIYRRATVHNLYPIAGAPLAPGTVASIYGIGLASGTAGASSLPLPVSLQGTSVSVGGMDAPIYSVSAGQINIQIPVGLTPNATYPVIVKSNGTISGVESITIANASPGVAAFADGTLIAQHASYQLVDAAHPAAPNEALIIYLGGMGATNPLVGTGQQAPSNPLANLPVLPKMTVDGKDAGIVFAGLTPGGIGLYQMVFTVPSGITTSGNKVVTISQSGTNANSTTLPVAVP
jgi:uncharacterized protein (TIGR03437 family)